MTFEETKIRDRDALFCDKEGALENYEGCSSKQRGIDRNTLLKLLDKARAERDDARRQYCNGNAALAVELFGAEEAAFLYPDRVEAKVNSVGAVVPERPSGALYLTTEDIVFITDSKGVSK